MTRTSFGTVSHAERLPGAPNPVPTTPPSQLYERALTMVAMGFHGEATKVLRDITGHAPGHAPAWEKLAELLRLAEKDKEASDAMSRAANGSAVWPAPSDGRTPAEIAAAEHALLERVGTLETPPERLKELRDYLRSHEIDAPAMRLLGRLERQDGDLITARALFERALVLAPDYDNARADLADLLLTVDENKRAVAESGLLIARAPANIEYRALHANALCAVGDFDSAISMIEQVTRAKPTNARVRRVYARSLYIAGRREDSAREYRACLALEPGMAEAYGGLAELRGDYLTAHDIAAMRERLRDSNLDLESRRTLQYALGQALEQARDFSGSFAAYEAGVALSRTVAANRDRTYYPAKEADELTRRRAVFAAPLLARAAPVEKPPHTPIFVVGLPRAGSTLVEQILASHSLVEGTMELPVLENIVRDLTLSRRLVTPEAYPECVRGLSRSELADLGERYLEEARAYRRTQRPYFVDKRPWNWLEAGLIRLILPHAKIVDVRREPMAACFAMYKLQLEIDSQFPYGFRDLAHCYTQYAGMMAHYETVMPGYIHFLSYERLVEDTESEVRRLLGYCGLPFEESCLRFWETGRAVATPSGEQVRQPIYRDAVGQWRYFEPWLGPLKEALKEAETVAAAAPQPPGYDSALMLAAMSMLDGATEELRAITRREPKHAGAWNKLAEFLRLAGEDREADEASVAATQCAGEASRWLPTRDPRTTAQLAFAERKLQERCSGMDRSDQMDLLRDHLSENPADAAAARMLARLESEDGDYVTALTLLERIIELAPFYHLARADFAALLLRRKYYDRAVEQSTILLQQIRDNTEYRALHSDALSSAGDFEAALAVTEELLREQPRHPQFLCGYGKLLHYLGRRNDSARAFRTCLDISPTMGEAWWGLADLKSGLLTDADLAIMRGCLADATLDPSRRMHIWYALGQAFEQADDFSATFTAYQEGARLLRGAYLSRGEAYKENALLKRVREVKRVYNAGRLANSAALPATCLGPTPIFIVGMPRAGSTLVEQILASHSQVEGTRELPLVRYITRELALSRRIVTPNAYPDCVLKMAPARLAALGGRYLSDARRYRKTDRPWFTDKRPWNWLEVGLIHLILPHAKIIDIRREPMAACFAMFKQVLTDGADFSNDLNDVGRYYTEYGGLMEYWRSVLPGRVHFMQYERLVEDTETEIRRMLDYCGLPFEEGCLRFWETDRTVSTPSAEQVRRPIFRDAMHQWRNFEPWLGPLKAALSKPACA